MKLNIVCMVFSLCVIPALQDSSKGGKADNLELLHNIPGIRIPKWFVLSSKMVQEFIYYNGIEKLIDQLNELCLKDPEKVQDILDLTVKIQEAFLSGEMVPDHLKTIQEGYEKLKQDLSKDKLAVAVRSSGILEDRADSSFAGLYDTYLNCKGYQDIYTAI
ncbi:MAG TPA: PEP/pyruvate-binding domain-containing protein, partial [Candidatus Babeliaceae bacterium]|nr:PEP/pyruvate-binding domain-containing protein [Candidatus Babeliaceae bacterium]